MPDIFKNSRNFYQNFPKLNYPAVNYYRSSKREPAKFDSHEFLIFQILKIQIIARQFHTLECSVLTRSFFDFKKVDIDREKYFKVKA